MKPKLRLVGQNPADIFNDLERLQGEMQVRRPRTSESFARIPHDRGLALYREVGGAAWAVLIELDRIILKQRGRNPIRLTSSRLRGLGLTHRTRARALRKLEEAGVVKVAWRGNGLSPIVTHLWYPVRG